eukprot:TRINITY_DN97163_c0_g1_i1.p1 TRINITY_DN97163_c0_g1~~TRINITY_DN97163_c0_g1_i1.p1  ORF type:complete len:194 (-),score=16.17 TRINITY_DN97163_c0_g1_i1:99-596(-)
MVRAVTARRWLLPCLISFISALAVISQCFLTSMTSRRPGSARSSCLSSQRFADDVLAFDMATPAADTIQLSINLFSDTECADARRFISRPAGPVELNKCLYSEEDKMEVFYTCEQGAKLHSVVYSGNGGCSGTPYLETKDIQNDKCSLMPPLGAGIWTWTGGCGA